MIIRSIRVADWRCFLDAVEVGPLDDGLHIIYAPNAIGKSTLFEALQRVLLDGHKVTGKEVEAIRPWGRQLAPKVTLEFVHQGQEYRITKQFLDNQSALLERKENDKYERFAEGVAADEKTRELLTKNPPGRGLARLDNWGLAQILWASQGNLTLEKLSGDLVTDIRGLLNTQVSHTATGPIEKQIEERYLEVYSPRGKIKTGKDAPPLVHLKESIEDAEEARRIAWNQCLAFEDASWGVEESRACRAQARHDADEMSKSLRDARTVVETYRQIVAEKDQLVEKVTAAEAQYKVIKQQIDTIKATQVELSVARKDVNTIASDLPLKEREVQDREQEARRLKSALEDARKGREKVDSAKRLAEAARRFDECRRELLSLNELIKKVKKTEKALAERREKRSTFVAPDVKILRAVLKALRERDEAQVRIDASLITLEIVPRHSGSVEVIAGEITGIISLTPEEPTQIKGSPEIVAEIAEVARLRAWGPTGSIEEHRDAQAKAASRLRELTEPYGTTDVEALESLVDKAKGLDAEVAESETELQTLLSGASLVELLQNRSVLEGSLAQFTDAHSDWAKKVPNSLMLETAADKIETTFISTVEGLEDEWEKAQIALTAVAGHREILARQQKDGLRRVDSLVSKIAELTIDGKSPSEREAMLQKATMAWDAAQNRLKDINSQLESYGENPTAIVERMEAQLEGANQASNEAREKEVREETKLESLCTQGVYSLLSLAEERLAQLAEEIKREEIRIEAVRLLHDTVATCRAEAVASISSPVEAVATRTLRRISGRKIGNIKVGEEFRPSAVVPDAMSETVQVDNLSGGEKEQLYLATRLALADVLAKDDRQMLVFDDVLTATDSGRLARIMTILEEAAQRLQIIILTCHPERYRGLKQATFHDLERLVHNVDLK